MTTITWTISQTDYLVADGFITTAHWRATAVDGEFTESIYSMLIFAPGTPTISYNEVTQNDVLNWIWANGVDKEATESSLTQKIEQLKNPVKAAGLPWAI